MKFKKIETNLKRNLFLNSSYVDFSSKPKTIENEVIRVNPEFTFQEFLGFGGALTESSCYILSKLENSVANEILDEYFSKNNLNYQFARISIGSCDFSLKSYSYAYKNDLSDFSINHDLQCIIPIIKSAKEKNNTLKIIASPWSPPAFMKDNNNLKRWWQIVTEI